MGGQCRAAGFALAGVMRSCPLAALGGAIRLGYIGCYASAPEPLARLVSEQACITREVKI